ncbi:MAG TPA: flavoprotein [Ktedonobacteraceae bacterium]|nr:flavoprotein [Ktedonobacteraceae bacterium]
MTESAHHTLYIIACASRVAGRIDKLILAAQEAGWNVCVIATPKAVNFIDQDALEKLTGYPVRNDYKRPEEPDILPPADALIAFPATFNTINKWALGISDTLALGLLNEYTGRKKPVLAVPVVTTNSGLDSHPAFSRSMALLREYGVSVLYDPERYPPRNEVPPETILQTLTQLLK